jgi:hypothetical protein
VTTQLNQGANIAGPPPKKKSKSKYDARFFRDLFLIFLIFCFVRLLMLSTGIVIIWIPYLDNCLVPIAKFINDPNLRYNVENWYMRFEAKYLTGFGG